MSNVLYNLAAAKIAEILEENANKAPIALEPFLYNEVCEYGFDGPSYAAIIFDQWGENEQTKKWINAAQSTFRFWKSQALAGKFNQYNVDMVFRSFTDLDRIGCLSMLVCDRHLINAVFAQVYSPENFQL